VTFDFTDRIDPLETGTRRHRRGRHLSAARAARQRPWSAIAYAAPLRDVRHVVVDKRMVVRDWRSHTLDVTRVKKRRRRP